MPFYVGVIGFSLAIPMIPRALRETVTTLNA